MMPRDYIDRRRMRRAAADFVIAINTGHALDAATQRMRYLGFATVLRERGVEVGSMLEEAAGGYVRKPI